MPPSKPSLPLRLVPIALLLAGMAGTGRAAVVARVRQGSTEWTMSALMGTVQVPMFYRYGNPDAFCANTGLETDATSLLFLYDDPLVVGPSPPALALVMIHDAPGNAGGGRATFDISGLPPSATYAVKDDAADSYLPAPPISGRTTATWTWATSDTDGAAFEGIGSARFCLAIQPNFAAGISTWQTLDGPSLTSPTRFVIPNLVDIVHVCVDCQALAGASPTVTACDGSGAYVALVAAGESLCGTATITNDRTAGGADASDTYPLGSTDVTFTLVDSVGFTTTRTVTVTVTPEATLPAVTACPAPLIVDCTGVDAVPVTDPRIESWVAQFAATDDCRGLTLSNDLPDPIPSGCNGSVTRVRFTATDASGNVATCTSSVTVMTDCLAPPRDVGNALRATSHGDPLASQVTATFEWSRDEGLPRSADEHYHVLSGTAPTMLAQVPGTEPWAATTFEDSTPAATSLPFVRYYAVLASGPCEDVSAD